MDKHTRLNRPWLPILMYHRVSAEPDIPGLTVTPAQFERQLAFLKRRGYQGINLSQLADSLEGKISLPDRAVVITFDDGYQDNYTQAWPLLKKYGYSATIFLVSDFVGQDSSFDRERPAQYKASPLLNQAQIQEMAEAGIEFGSHTCTHRALPALTIPERKHELERSRQNLSALVNKEISSFAYPYSRLSEDIVAEVAAAGYRLAVAGKGATFEPYQLNRIEPTYLPLLALRMSPIFQIIQRQPFYSKLRQVFDYIRRRIPKS